MCPSRIDRERVLRAMAASVAKEETEDRGPGLLIIRHNWVNESKKRSIPRPEPRVSVRGSGPRGSFAAAAATPGSSRQLRDRKIQELEAQVDSRLIHRSTRRLTLTAADAPSSIVVRRGVRAGAGGTGLGHDTRFGERPDPVAAPADFFRSVQIDGWRSFWRPIRKCAWSWCSTMRRPTWWGKGSTLHCVPRTGRRQSHRSQDHWQRSLNLVASPAYLRARGNSCDVRIAGDHVVCHSRSHRPVTWRLEGPGGASEIQVSSRFFVPTPRERYARGSRGFGYRAVATPHHRVGDRAGRLLKVLAPTIDARAPICTLFVSAAPTSARGVSIIEFSVDRLRASLSA